jgi:hypothetical protein
MIKTGEETDRREAFELQYLEIRVMEKMVI